MTVEVEPFENPNREICRHPKCDGRPAKWSYPQTKSVPLGPLVSCSVHAARFIEIVLELNAAGKI
jgi:hypothetical protein